jgi:integrase
MTFDDIDRDHRTWRIFRTITRTRTGASVLGTATKTGRERTITLPTAAFEAIERQRIEVARARLAASWWDTTEEPLVFPTTIGTVRDSKPLRTELHDTCPWWSHSPFHSLRHFYATVTITDGALPVEVVSKVLGHASTRVTTTVYSHLMPESSQAAGEGITRALGD